MTENWKSIVGLEGLYEVSDLGRVRSLDRKVTYDKRDGRTVTANFKGRVLALSADTNGYLAVGLPKLGTRTVHVLVLNAFVGPKPEGAEALHGDGNYQNAKLLNLRWGTHAQNMLDRHRHGTVTIAKLDADKVRSIRASNKSSEELALDFTVNRRTIDRVKRRDIWRHVE